MIVQRLHLQAPETVNRTRWPYSIPAVAAMGDHGLEFHRPVTFLVGENGSGKSTIVEAIADACKIPSHGGKGGTKYASTTTLTPLGEVLQADLTVEGRALTLGPRRRRKGFFFRAETLFNLGQNVSGMYGFWDEPLTEQSHGEGFFTVLEAMFNDPGLYLMDEPEAALSFTSCLRLVALMDHLATIGGQIICATHSPILTALPGADILELGDHGLRRTAWDQLQLVDHWRRFMAKPDLYLRHITNDEDIRR
ncbi:AAA family ATPase [Actinoallomurus purpureus]|uniref:AAA family ATPase n=1 Tax=Actinoallomurus purpureus TaxID=478114 RepID=UPI00209261F4|nr:AAA family ATPase [Actinoallomurus purpureus]MCO6007155.1 AAA family ATPase [Actinoallomurus purpureus]